ncbi:MAG TPA: hypothetical protein HPP94_04805 [Desulfuromonadales bacterium]|nr:hypothetical protein [Desulfuromonadales bacterium]
MENTQEKLQHRIECLEYKSKSPEGRDDIDVLASFCESYAVGVSPASWIMARLNAIFAKYLHKNMNSEKTTLDELFNITLHDFEDLHRKSIYSDLFSYIEALHYYYRVTYDDAYTMVLQNFTINAAMKFKSIGICPDEEDSENKEHREYIG